jgi:phosphoglycolate phosphatase
MIQLVIFDLDGTLLDTSPGIINCYDYIAREYQRPLLDRTVFREVIGGPLRVNLQKYYRLNAIKTAAAVRKYREKYARTGVKEALLYPGVPELLQELKSGGSRLAVATLKRQDLAVKILHNFQIAGYFELILGMDMDDTLTKTSLVELCLQKLNVSGADTVLVGDSLGDYQSAQQAGIGFIAAGYGFGVLDGALPCPRACSAGEIPRLLLYN